jgi:hypothetical protein
MQLNQKQKYAVFISFVVLALLSAPFLLPAKADFVKTANYRLPPYTVNPQAYNDVLVAADMAKLRSLGANTVEVYIPYKQIDVPMIQSFLVTCQNNGLKAIITLFDWASPFSELDESKQYLREIVTSLKDNEAIYAWGLINEVNLKNVSDTQKETWIRQMVQTIREIDAKHKITLEFQAELCYNISLMEKTHDLLDFVSISFFNPIIDFGLALDRVKGMAESTPIYLSEFGYTNRYAGTQEAYFTLMIQQVKINEKSLVGCGFWALKDFPTENAFGVFDSAGNEKLAAKIIREYYK